MAKIKLGMRVEIIKAVMGEIQSTKQPYYKIVIEQDGEVISFSCTELVYNEGSGLKGEMVNLVGEFNDDYKKIRITGIVKGK